MISLITKHLHCLRHYFLILLLLFDKCHQVAGNFGDYADLTFQCPALTTCPLVCVTNYSSCPTSMSCSNGITPCMDGTCAADGVSCSAEMNSFAFSCTEPYPPVACAKTIDYFNSCLETYQEAYDYQTQYSSEFVAATTSMLTLKEPFFIFCYTWICFITVTIILWCAYNQRWSVISGSTRPLQEVVTTENGVGVAWTQTGYKIGVIGTLIYFLVMLTLIGFQVLLLLITLSYYNLQGDIAVRVPVIEDEEQVLLCFIIVWMVGFLFSLALKWNKQFSSLFLRRCSFEKATHIAVCAPIDEGKGIVFTQKGCIYRVSICMGYLKKNLQAMMAFIFSDVNSSSATHKVFFCRVVKQGDEKFFFFRLRKYIFDPLMGEFIPGSCEVGKTIGEFIEAKGGLSSADATKRLNVIGPNSIHMSKPNYVKSVIHEFSGTFYVYQNYIIW